MKFIKDNKGLTFFTILFTYLYISSKDYSYLMFIGYIYLIKYIILSNHIKEDIRIKLNTILWVIGIGTLILTYYVNNSLPHGQSYSTGDVICEYDGRGRCYESSKEDMRGLNIPDWAKFIREYWEILIIVMIITGIANSTKIDGFLKER